MTRTRLSDHPDWWRVRDVMTTHVTSVDPSTTYDEMVDLVLTHQVSGLPVTDGAGRLLGIVTEADLMRRELCRSTGTDDAPADRDTSVLPPAAGDDLTAGGLMSCTVLTASPDDDLPGTARKLLGSGHRRLPVVSPDGVLVGVVSRRDLLAPAWDYADEAP